MKRILFVSVLGVFVLGLTVAMAAAENFSGTWALDYSKSQGLPENAPKDMTWTVSQTDKELVIERPGQPGRGGAGGAATPAPAPYKAVYKLDGTETAEETPGPRPGKLTRKAKWLAGGKTLELNDVRNVNVQGNDVTITTTEHWELTDGGKTLKVHRKQESPQGARETTFILNKK